MLYSSRLCLLYSVRTCNFYMYCNICNSIIYCTVPYVPFIRFFHDTIPTSERISAISRGFTGCIKIHMSIMWRTVYHLFEVAFVIFLPFYLVIYMCRSVRYVSLDVYLVEQKILIS